MRINNDTAIQLLRMIMEAHYADLVNEHNCKATGLVCEDYATEVNNLELDLHNMVETVVDAMDKGELTPFNGNYTEWLKQRGILDN